MRITLLCIFAVIACASAIAPLHLKKEPIANSYIVVFKPTTSAVQLSLDMKMLKQAHNITYKYTYSTALRGFSAHLDSVQLAHIRSHPRVDFVEQDQIARASACEIQNNAIWGLNRISQRDINLDGTYTHPTHAGSGVDAYIFDTGVRTTHSEFKGRAFFDYKADSSWSNSDLNGHGTHVASTVAGALYGVAKQARIYAYKVLGDDGSGSIAGIVGAVDAALQKYNSRGRPGCGNMSLGGGFSQALNNAVSSASQSGLIMVVAAGNENQDACRVSPASAPNVITVGATDVETEGLNEVDIRSSFSNFGTCVSVFAPGSLIKGAWYTSDTATNTISGTSMASPHVCGAVALYLAQNPSASFSQTKSAIQSTASNNKIDLTNSCGSSVCRATTNKLVYVANC
jgi:subtilisin family serine protease